MSDDYQAPPPAPPAPPAPPPPPVDASAPDSSTRTVALLGWIFAPLGLIGLAVDPYKDSAWFRAHALQAAGVWLAGLVLSSVTFGLASIAAFIYQVITGLKANKGQSVEVPLIHGIVKGMINP